MKLYWRLSSARRWFEKEPSVLDSFPNYKGMSISDLRPMPQVRTHGSHLFLALTGIIFNLENDHVTGEMLGDLKRDHDKWQPTLTTDNYSVQYFLISFQELLFTILCCSRVMLVLMLSCRSFHMSRSCT